MYTCSYMAEGVGPVLKWEECLAWLLVQAGVCVGLNTDIFIGPVASNPPGAGPLVTISEYPGAPPRGIHNGGASTANKYERLTAQVIARAEDPEAAMNRALACFRTLGAIYNVDVAV